VQESVEVPEPGVMDDGLRVHVRPVEGDAVAERFTVFEKPFRGATVSVEVTAVFGLVLMETGSDPMEKSGLAAGAVMVRVMVAEDEDVPAGSPLKVSV
jgi:hypothetical protein